MRNEAIRILIVDDDVLACEALRLRLAEAKMKIVGVVHTGVEAMNLIEGLKPDVVLWDDAMPDMNGRGALARLKENGVGVRLMIMTGRGTKIRAAAALAEGAVAIINKEQINLKLLPDMIRILARGREAVVEAELLRETIASQFHSKENLPKKRNPVSETRNHPDELSVREFGVLQLAVGELHETEIADELSIDVMAVRKHLDSICRKLQVDDVSKLGLVAARLGLVDNR